MVVKDCSKQFIFIPCIYFRSSWVLNNLFRSESGLNYLFNLLILNEIVHSTPMIFDHALLPYHLFHT